ELEGRAGEAEMAAADGDGAGGDDQHLLATRAAAREIGHQGRQPGVADRAARLVDEQRRADLDDQPARGGEAARRRRLRIRAGRAHGWYSITLGAVSLVRAAAIAVRSADSTAGTPAPLTPESTITSRRAA